MNVRSSSLHSVPGQQRALADVCARMHAAGWVANHDGNASVRMPDMRFLATPTAMSKRDVQAHDVITVDLQGKRLGGRRRLFSEWSLHAAAYGARLDVNAVLHAHPPAVTALGLAGRAIGTAAMPEVIVSLGANIPLLSAALPKDSAQEAELQRALDAGDAEVVMITGNGVLAVGADLEMAYLRLELVEHYAKILVATLPLGGPSALSDAQVQKILAARTRAGLGKRGRAG